MNKFFLLLILLACKDGKENISLSKEAKIIDKDNIIPNIQNNKIIENNTILEDVVSDLSAQTIKNVSNIKSIKSDLVEVKEGLSNSSSDLSTTIKEVSRLKLGIDFSLNQKGHIYPGDSFVDKNSFYIPTVSIGNSDNILGLKLESKDIITQLYLSFVLKNSSLNLSRFNLFMPFKVMNVKFFKDSSVSLPFSTDFLRSYSNIDLVPLQGFTISSNFKYSVYSGDLNSFIGYKDFKDTLFINLDNSVLFGENLNSKIAFNINYIESGEGSLREEYVLKDREWKGILSLDFNINSNGNIYDSMFDINYIMSRGKDTINSRDDFMKSITLFKINEYDALSIYFNTTLFNIKNIRLKGGLFESGQYFYDEFSSKDIDAKSKKENTEYRSVFKESDVIDYKKDGSGMFFAISIGEGKKASQELSIHNSPKNNDPYKIGIKSRYSFSNVISSIDLGIYGLNNSFFKLESGVVINSKTDIEIKTIVTRDSSIRSNEDNNFILGSSFELSRSIYSDDLLSLKLSSLNRGILKNNTSGSFSMALEYSSGSIAHLYEHFGDSDYITVGLDYLNKNSIINISNSRYFTHLHVGISTYEMFLDNLLIKANLLGGLNHKSFVLGALISSKYYISNKSSFNFKVGNVIERDRTYYINRNYKLKTSFEDNKSKFQIEKDINFDIGISISI